MLKKTLEKNKELPEHQKVQRAAMYTFAVMIGIGLLWATTLLPLQIAANQGSQSEQSIIDSLKREQQVEQAFLQQQKESAVAGARQQQPEPPIQESQVNQLPLSPALESPSPDPAQTSEIPQNVVTLPVDITSEE